MRGCGVECLGNVQKLAGLKPTEARPWSTWDSNIDQHLNIVLVRCRCGRAHTSLIPHHSNRVLSGQCPGAPATYATLRLSRPVTQVPEIATYMGIRRFLDAMRRRFVYMRDVEFLYDGRYSAGACSV